MDHARLRRGRVDSGYPLGGAILRDNLLDEGAELRRRHLGEEGGREHRLGFALAAEQRGDLIDAPSQVGTLRLGAARRGERQAEQQQSKPVPHHRFPAMRAGQTRHSA